MLHNVTQNHVLSPARCRRGNSFDCCMVLAGLIKHVCHWWCVPSIQPVPVRLCLNLRCVRCPGGRQPSEPAYIVFRAFRRSTPLPADGLEEEEGAGPRSWRHWRDRLRTWTSSTPPHICIFVMKYLYHTDKRTATFAIAQLAISCAANIRPEVYT